MKPLTEKRLLAIREALNFRLAGEMDDAELDQQVYRDALEWVREKIRDKQQRRQYSEEAKRLRAGRPSIPLCR